MARRFAAISTLILAALALSPAARAQGFFSFYEASPHDILSRLDEQGYSARTPMTRRGDVYIVDARMPSGRSVRLIVSAHDGSVLERYAVTPRYEEYGHARWRDEAPSFRRGDDDEGGYHPERRPQAALGEPGRPHVLNFDGQNQDRMIPPAAVPEGAAPERPRHHAVKKPIAPPVARETTEPSVTAVAPFESKPASPRIVELPKAVIAPVKTETKTVPAPEPTSQAKVEAPKAEAPKIVREPAQQAKVEDKSAPNAETPKVEAPRVVREVAPAQAKADEKPKSEAPRKKLNDLPVGTLD